MIKFTPPMGWNSWNTFGENINEKFSVQGVQTRLKRNDRFEISDRVVN